MAVEVAATARTRTSSDTGTARWHAARAKLGTKFNFQSRVESRMGWAGNRTRQSRAGHIGMQVANVIIVLDIDIIVSE